MNGTAAPAPLTAAQTRTAEQLEKAKQATEQLSDFDKLLLKDIKAEVRFKPLVGDEDLRLSIHVVRTYIAVPYIDRDGKEWFPDDRECIRFIGLCRARQLNPWELDAYMIPFWDGKLGKPVWSLITSHNAVLKRAELNRNYNGMASGIIIIDNEKKLQFRDGDFKHPGDTIVGGWADVNRKDQAEKNRKRVNLEVYSKPFGNWSKDPGGMICKVAEAQALRDAFPTVVGGMYLREEMDNMQETASSEEPRSLNRRPARPGPQTGLGAEPSIHPDAGKVVDLPPAKVSPEAGKPSGKPVAAPEGVKTPAATETQRQASAASEQGQHSASDEEAERNMGLGPAPAAQEPAKPAATGSPAPVSEPAGAPAPVLAKPDYKPTEPFEPRKDETPELQNVRYLLWKCGKTEEQLKPILLEKRLMKDDQKLGYLSTKRLADIAKAWDTTFLPELNKAE